MISLPNSYITHRVTGAEPQLNLTNRQQNWRQRVFCERNVFAATVFLIFFCFSNPPSLANCSTELAGLFLKEPRIGENSSRPDASGGIFVQKSLLRDVVGVFEGQKNTFIELKSSITQLQYQILRKVIPLVEKRLTETADQLYPKSETLFSVRVLAFSQYTLETLNKALSQRFQSIVTADPILKKSQIEAFEVLYADLSDLAKLTERTLTALHAIFSEGLPPVLEGTGPTVNDSLFLISSVQKLRSEPIRSLTLQLQEKIQIVLKKYSASPVSNNTDQQVVYRLFNFSHFIERNWLISKIFERLQALRALYGSGPDNNLDSILPYSLVLEIKNSIEFFEREIQEFTPRFSVRLTENQRNVFLAFEKAGIFPAFYAKYQDRIDKIGDQELRNYLTKLINILESEKSTLFQLARSAESTDFLSGLRPITNIDGQLESFLSDAEKTKFLLESRSSTETGISNSNIQDQKIWVRFLFGGAIGLGVTGAGIYYFWPEISGLFD